MAQVGKKYQSGQDVKETAKLVRKDIKAGIKSGLFPAGLKASVTIERYSMGQSLSVHVTAVPETFQVVNPARVIWERDNPHDWYNKDIPSDARARYSDCGQKLLDDLESLVLAYARRDVDSSTDYYNVSFSHHVGYDYRVTKAQEAAVESPAVEPAPAPEPPAVEVKDDDEPAGYLAALTPKFRVIQGGKR